MRLRAFRTATVGAIILILAGCTYHGVIETSLQSPDQGATAHKKIPLKLAIVKNKALQNRPLRVRGGSHGVEINYYDALTADVETSLRGFFSAVRVVDDPTQAESSELLAEYNMQYRETYRNEWSGNLRFETLFTVQLKESATGLVVAQAQHSDEMQYSPPAGARAGAIATGASLFLLSPITIPLTTLAIGNEAENLVKESIKTSVSTASQKFTADARLLALVRTREGLDTATGSRPTRYDTHKTLAAPPSKYDDFLNAVVVVRSSRGVGSGFFVSQRGHLVTNEHVVGRDASVSVRLRSGTVIIGTVIASEADADLALVSVAHQSPVWLELAKPEEGGIGSDVIAIGTPEGLSWSVSKGIVSAVRDVGGTRLIQTDAPINRGNSGGPLILLESGRVIGVNTFGFKREVAEGLNFAVGALTVGAKFHSYLKR